MILNDTYLQSYFVCLLLHTYVRFVGERSWRSGYGVGLRTQSVVCLTVQLHSKLQALTETRFKQWPSLYFMTTGDILSGE